VSPVYPFFVFFGGVVDSPVSSGAMARLKRDASREARRPSCLHGPGESLANSGDGRGVRSPIAEMTGLATVELAAEAEPKGPYFPVFRLGVLETGRSDWAEDLFRSDRAGRLVDLTGVV
jgi:hypothetical protein